MQILKVKVKHNASVLFKFKNFRVYKYKSFNENTSNPNQTKFIVYKILQLK